MTILSRWLAPAVLAAGLGVGAMTPAPARAHDDDLVRIVVDVADVIFRGGYPYYRHGPAYGYNDRLIVVHDRYRRPVYYRYVPRETYLRYRSGPPYGHAYGYWRDGRWWDGRRWHDRDVRYYRDRDRHWESRNWRDDDRRWDRDRRYHKFKDKGRHGHRRGRDDD